MHMILKLLTKIQLTYIVGEEDDKEWCDKVIDALDVAAGRVSHGPDKQNTLKTFLYDLLLEQRHIWIHTRNINGNLQQPKVQIVKERIGTR